MFAKGRFVKAFQCAWISYSTIFPTHGIIATLGTAPDYTAIHDPTFCFSSLDTLVWTSAVFNAKAAPAYGRYGNGLGDVGTPQVNRYQRPALPHISVLDKYQKRV